MFSDFGVREGLSFLSFYVDLNQIGKRGRFGHAHRREETSHSAGHGGFEEA